MKCTIFVSLFVGAVAFAPIVHKTSSTAVPPFVTTSTALVSSVADPKMSFTALKMGLMDFFNENGPLVVFLGGIAAGASIFAYLDQRFDTLKEDVKDLKTELKDDFGKQFALTDKNIKELKDDFGKQFALTDKKIKELKDDFGEQFASTKKSKSSKTSLRPTSIQG
jgi:hypothetical protein